MLSKPQKLLVRLIFLCVFIVASPAWAAKGTKDELIDKAAQHLRDKAPQKAYDLLEPYEVTRAGDPDFDLTFGVAANQTGKFTRAIMALERVLIVSPNRLRAKTELATAYFAVRDNDRAKRLLADAKSQKGVPTDIARTIDQFMRTIDRFDKVEPNTKFNYTGYIGFGIGHDTNASSAPDESTFNVPLFNLPFSLAPSAQKHSTEYASLDAGLSGRYHINHRFSWIGSVNFSHTHNSHTNSDSTQSIGFSTGPAYLYERHEWSLALQVGSSFLENRRALDTVGVTGNWIYRPTGFNQFGTYVQHLKRNDTRNSSADTERTVLGITYSHMFRNAFFTFGGLYLAKEKPEDGNKPQLGHDAWGLRLGVQYSINPKLAVYASVSYEDRDFGGRDRFFLRTRQDKQTNVSLGLNWTPHPRWVISPNISYSKSHSNISLHDFERQRISLSAKYVF